VYEGPGLPIRINKRLVKLMNSAGVESTSEITGSPPSVY